jgi:hypothetical protein
MQWFRNLCNTECLPEATLMDEGICAACNAFSRMASLAKHATIAQAIRVPR